MRIIFNRRLGIIGLFAIFLLSSCSEQSPLTNDSSYTHHEEITIVGLGNVIAGDIVNSNGFLLKFSSSLSLSDQQTLLDRYGLMLVNRSTLVSGLVYVEVQNSDNIIETLEQVIADENVVYAEPDYPVFVHDSQISLSPDKVTPSQKNQVSNVGSALFNSDVAENQSVAILDTGIDFNHTALFENIWINSNEIPRNGIDDDANGWVDDIYGWNFVENDNNPMDDNNHGTHVAGIVSGNATGDYFVKNNAIKVIALRVLNENGEGRISNILEAFEYIVKNDIGLSLNSWGLKYNSKSLFDLFQALNSKNHLVVSGAGNNAKNIVHSPFYPASYQMNNILSVASLSANSELSNISNYGNNSIEIASLGENINSTIRNDAYLTLSDTSLAAALTLNHALQYKLANNLITGQELKLLVLDQADTLDTLNDKVKDNKAILNGITIEGSTVTIGDEPGTGILTDKVILSAASFEVAIGESMQLNVIGGTAPYTWRVNNALFASVNENGVITGVTVGSTGISVEDSAGIVSNEIVVTITPMMIVAEKEGAISISEAATFSAKGGVPPYEWTIDNELIASGLANPEDSSQYIVTPIALGEIQITLSDSIGNIANSGIITIGTLPLSVDPSALVMTLNQSQQLNASGGSSPYQWISSDLTIASINDSGMLTAIAPGNATIIVTDAANDSKAIAVTVNPELTIEASNTIIAPDDTLQLSLVGGSANAIWSTSDATIIDVDTAGLVTGINPGIATITVEDGSNSGSIDIEVRQLTISQAPNEIAAGDVSVQLHVSGGVAPYTWTVNDSSIASVNAQGEFSPLLAGTVVVTVTDSDNFTSSISININPAPLSVNLTNAVIALGETLQLVVTGGDGNYSWSNTDNTVVSLNTSGLITALSEGSSSVTVQDGTGQSFVISVTVGSIGIQVDSTSILITSAGIQLTGVGGDGSYTWSVDNSSIASIDQTGYLTPINLGSVIVTLTEGGGLSGNITITVTSTPVSLSADKQIISLTDTAILTVSGGDSNYTLSSSDASIIAIDNVGNAIPMAVGNAQITATDGLGQTASIWLEVRDVQLSATTTSLVVGDPALTLSVSGGAAPYTWSSSDSSIATVSSNGLVVAQAAGSATVTVVDIDGFSSSINLTVGFSPLGIVQGDQILAINESMQLTVTGGNNQLIWSSSNSSIVSVDSEGVLNSLAQGTVMITVTDSAGDSDSVSVVVRDVAISADSTTIVVGDTGIQLSASGGTAPYSWSSSDSNVISITSSGIINAESIGSATITVTDADGISGSLNFTVTPTPLAVADNSIIIGIGDSFNVNVTGGNGSYSYSSSNNSVASVNNSGDVQGESAGSSTITITDGYGQSITASVEVRSISVSANSTSIDITDGTLQLSATGGNGSYSWSSDDTAIATVNSSGLLATRGVGTVTITVTDTDNIVGSISITITATPVSLNTSSALVEVGNTVQLNANGGDESYSWSSSNTDIATVNSNGRVTGVALGTATITVTDGLGQTATSTITVRDVTLSASTTTITVGDPALQVSASGGNGSYSWSSSNTGLATVDSSGQVTAVAAGTVTITATDSDGFSGTISITVNAAPFGGGGGGGGGH